MKPFRPHRRKPPPPPATKPAPAVDVAAIDRINELARTARTLWYGLLSYLAFVGVTLLGVEDADFFITERQTQLPLVNVSIPTNLFFIFAPILGAAFYTYLHHHLMKLWVALADQREPATGPALSDLLLPWIVIDLVFDLRPGPPRSPQPLRRLAVFATILLVFIATPAILTGFWWRSMPAHDGWMTVAACGLALLLALFVSLHSFEKLWDTTRPLPKQRNWRWVSLSNTAWLIFLVLLSSFGWFKTAGDFDAFVVHLTKTELGTDPHWWHQGQVFGSSLLNFPTEADLENVVFVEKPADWRDYQTARAAFRVTWCKNLGLKPEVCGPVPSLIAKVPDNEPYQPGQRMAWCRETFGPYSATMPEPIDLAQTCISHFAKLDFQFGLEWDRERNAALDALPARDLSGADLRGAVLRGAAMERVSLRNAHLEHADLSFVVLEGAILSSAIMENAKFRRAKMELSHLDVANLENTHFEFASLEGADFHSAKLFNAIFSETNMNRAEFKDTHFEDSTVEKSSFIDGFLDDAHFDRATISDSTFEGASLTHLHAEGSTFSTINFEGANLHRANFGFAQQIEELSLSRSNLRAVIFPWDAHLSQQQIESAYGDSGTILPYRYCKPSSWSPMTTRVKYPDRDYQAWLDSGALPTPPTRLCPNFPE